MADTTYWERKNGTVVSATTPAENVNLKAQGAKKLSAKDGAAAYKKQFEGEVSTPESGSSVEVAGGSVDTDADDDKGSTPSPRGGRRKGGSE